MRAVACSQTLATLPLIDLSPKCIKLIKEKGYPIIIDEGAPSRYSKYREETAGSSTTQGLEAEEPMETARDGRTVAALVPS